jgi:hypothetical protein
MSGLACIDGVCCGGEAADDASVGSWMRRAPLSGVRYSMGVVANRGYIYAVGGTYYIEGSGSGDLDVVQRYDPRTDLWVDRVKLPQASALFAATSFGGQIHTFNITTHWVYDPSTDQWKTLAALPKNVGSGAAAVVLGDQIHIVNGTTHLAWIPATDSWATKADAPASLSGSRAYIYDPVTDAWTTSKSSLLTARVDISGGSQSVVDGRVIIAAGNTTAAEAYDPKTDSFAALPPTMSPVRDRTGTTALCGRVYLLGGTTPGIAYPYNDVLKLR